MESIFSRMLIYPLNQGKSQESYRQDLVSTAILIH